MKPKEQNSSYDGADVRKIFIPFQFDAPDFPKQAAGRRAQRGPLLVAPWSLATHPDCVKQVRRSLGRLHSFDPRDKEAATSGTRKESPKPPHDHRGWKFSWGRSVAHAFFWAAWA